MVFAGDSKCVYICSSVTPALSGIEQVLMPLTQHRFPMAGSDVVAQLRDGVFLKVEVFRRHRYEVS